jgi:Alginate export
MEGHRLSLFDNMTTTVKQLAVTAVSLLWMASHSCGAAEAASGASVSAGLLNDWVRQQDDAMKAWDFGGEFRLRYEDYENAARAAGTLTSVPTGTKPLTQPMNPNTDFVARGQVNTTDELLTRVKFHAGWSPTSWCTVYGELRNSTSDWDQRLPAPDEDTGALQQAYVLLGDASQFPLLLKVGRQEMMYGDERFIGRSDWSNPGRTFDAVKLRYTNEVFWVDAFVSRIVVPYQDHFDEDNSFDTLSGIYASSRTIVPWQETEIYVLSRNAGPQAVSASAYDVPGTPSTARDIFTFGFRVKSLPNKLNGWDYSLEAAGQAGTINNAIVNQRLNQQAYAVFSEGGYTWTNVWSSPRLGVGYDGGTGDSNSHDGKSETFDNLFGTRHPQYGVMDLFCERNMHIARLSASCRPLKNLTLMADYRAFWLWDTNDYLYPISGSGRNNAATGYGIHPNYDSFVGTELDFIASYDVRSWWNMQAGYGHFFVGTYIKQSVGAVAATGGAVDANFVYVQTSFKF